MTCFIKIVFLLTILSVLLYESLTQTIRTYKELSLLKSMENILVVNICPVIFYFYFKRCIIVIFIVMYVW